MEHSTQPEATDAIPPEARAPVNQLYSESDRYLPSSEAARIRRALREECTPPGRYDRIRFDCYNADEKDAIAALLTPEERAKVTFTWFTWGGK